MEDNFFEDDYSTPAQQVNQQNQQQHQQHTEQQHNNEFGDYQEDRHQGEDEYQQYQDPVPTQEQTEVSHDHQHRGDVYFDQIVPEEVTPEMVEMRRRDQEIQRNLDKKRNEERGLKEERKQKGKRDLQQYKATRAKEIQRNKAKNLQESSKTIKAKQYTNEWQKVVDNIASKTGDYPGKKDVSRMRDALLRKSKD